MTKKTAAAISCLLLCASITGCGWERSGANRDGAAELSLPESTRLDSGIRETRTPEAVLPPADYPAPPSSHTEDAANPAPAPAPAPAPSKAKDHTPHPAPAVPSVPPRSDSGLAAPDKETAPAAQPERRRAAKPKKERPEKKSVPVQQHRVAQKSLSLAQLRQKYSNNFRVSGSRNENKIALTFDDGPDSTFTAQVLDVLKKNNVKATFFVLGFRAKQHPELISRMVREGHVVGNHSYNHANLPKLTEPNFELQVEQTQAILRSLLGYEPKLFRPPYGAVNEEQVRWAADHQFLIVNWNVDSLDWKGLSAERVSNNILTSTKPGSIILQHCGGGDGQDLSGTVKALPTVIEQLKSKGYRFVTVPELLHVPKNK